MHISRGWLAVLPVLMAVVIGCGPPAGANYLPATPTVLAPTDAAVAEGSDVATDSSDPAARVQAAIANLSPETVSIKGDQSAPLTIIEFSDYQCPFCYRYVSQTLPQIQAQYIDTGKVRYMFRDFPLNSIHPQAQAAAEAARCAGDQGDYWGMHNLLFARQVEWQSDDDTARKVFGQFAQELGLDSAALETCLAEGRFTDHVRNQTDEGVRLGINGTPSFLIGNQFLSGAQPFEVFQQVIEQQLAN